MRIRIVYAGVFVLCLLFTPSCVSSGSNHTDTGRVLAERYLEKKEITSLSLSPDRVESVRRDFIDSITKVLGEPVGYKVALTNPALQRRFNMDEPVWGVLLRGMLLENGTILHPRFGARPMVEGDLLVRIGDEGINDARTPVEVLRAIDSVIPFIELPDLMFSKGARIDGLAIRAVNGGARFGVMGREIPVTPTPEWQRRLRDFTVEILDGKGSVLTWGRGSNLMGDPLRVVIWLRDSLKKEGMRLKKGDLISLGSVTGLVPPGKKKVIRAVYRGLSPEGMVEVYVRFHTGEEPG